MLLSYSYIFIFILISLCLSILIFGFSFLLIKQQNDQEKLTPYECGFNPFNDARKTFNIKFYLVALLFIIFDLEAVYIFPWCLNLSSIYFLGFYTMIDFIFELIIGFIYVWCSNALEWD